MTDSHTWTAEDSQRLRDAHAQMFGPRQTVMGADLEIGNLLMPAFNAGLGHFKSLGVTFNANVISTTPLKVFYTGFTATGPEDIMREFAAWYRGFFRI